jgi:hypothetical protein
MRALHRLLAYKEAGKPALRQQKLESVSVCGCISVSQYVTLLSSVAGDSTLVGISVWLHLSSSVCDTSLIGISVCDSTLIGCRRLYSRRYQCVAASQYRSM